MFLSKEPFQCYLGLSLSTLLINVYQRPIYKWRTDKHEPSDTDKHW